jgi:hypothetical protein
MMMAMMGMLTVIAGMVGSSSVVIGFVIHLMISAIIGAGFGAIVGEQATSLARSAGLGVGYGIVWWVLGPLTMMPLMMGMGLGTQWSVAGITGALPSLMGHMIFGAITGVAYLRLANLTGTTRGAQMA